MVSFVDERREEHGVEPICQQLEIAPSTYYEAKARERDPSRRLRRAKRDAALSVDVKRVHQGSHGIYGARRVWKQLLREDVDVGRCTVEGLMRRLGLSGLVRVRKARTTWPADVTARPLDLVQRRFVAERPNQLWVSDLTHVATWGNRSTYVADVLSRRVVGWRVFRSLRTDLALDALEQALHARRDLDGLVRQGG